VPITLMTIYLMKMVIQVFPMVYVIVSIALVGVILKIKYGGSRNTPPILVVILDVIYM
jgi:hypothetical protein